MHLLLPYHSLSSMIDLLVVVPLSLFVDPHHVSLIAEHLEKLDMVKFIELY